MFIKLCFTEEPKVMPYGNKSIVPVGIESFEQENKNGENTVVYLAYVVYGVEGEVNVDSIVDAAIKNEFTEADRNYIMRNMLDSEDAKVNEYKEFVARVTTAAKNSGY